MIIKKIYNSITYKLIVYAFLLKGHNPSNFVVPMNTDPNINKVIDKKTDKTQLHQAIEEGKIDTVVDLLDKGADVDLHAKSGYTPLHFAVNKGSLPIIEELVKRGADITKVDKKGYSLLHLAAYFGHQDIVVFLLNNMSLDFITITDKQNKTAIDWAKTGKHTEIATLIDKIINEKKVQGEFTLTNESLVVSLENVIDNYHEDMTTRNTDKHVGHIFIEGRTIPCLFVDITNTDNSYKEVLIGENNFVYGTTGYFGVD